MAAKPDNETFSQNHRFWREVASVAVYLQTIGETPSKWVYVWESVKESVAEIPGTLATASSAAGQAIGEAVAAPIKGATNALGLTGRNLLIGAAVAVAGVVVTVKVLR